MMHRRSLRQRRRVLLWVRRVRSLLEELGFVVRERRRVYYRSWVKRLFSQYRYSSGRMLGKSRGAGSRLCVEDLLELEFRMMAASFPPNSATTGVSDLAADAATTFATGRLPTEGDMRYGWVRGEVIRRLWPACHCLHKLRIMTADL